MSDAPAPTRILRLLLEGGVDFVVVGGVAVVMHALPRFTRDLDIVYDPADENLERLSAVLVAVNARLRGLSDDLPFVPDAVTLRQMQILTLETDAGALDLLLSPDGAPPYAELRERAAAFELDGLVMQVAAIPDLIAMKRAAGRPQDEADIAALELAERVGRVDR